MTNSLTVFCESCGSQWKVCDYPVDVNEMVSLVEKAKCSCGAERECLYIGSLDVIRTTYRDERYGKEDKDKG